MMILKSTLKTLQLRKFDVKEFFLIVAIGDYNAKSSN